MQDRSSKRPRDLNALAHRLTQEATGEALATKPPIEREKDPAAVALGRRGGLKGGAARAKKLSPAERSEIARKAASTRWKKQGGQTN
ncbi:MAG: histone H1 [Chloroflexi bacterium]|nr:histone H1 [Chloroflexota bacterium]